MPGARGSVSIAIRCATSLSASIAELHDHRAVDAAHARGVRPREQRGRIGEPDDRLGIARGAAPGSSARQDPHAGRSRRARAGSRGRRGSASIAVELGGARVVGRREVARHARPRAARSRDGASAQRGTHRRAARARAAAASSVDRPRRRDDAERLAALDPRRDESRSRRVLRDFLPRAIRFPTSSADASTLDAPTTWRAARVLVSASCARPDRSSVTSSPGRRRLDRRAAAAISTARPPFGRGRAPRDRPRPSSIVRLPSSTIGVARRARPSRRCRWPSSTTSAIAASRRSSAVPTIVVGTIGSAAAHVCARPASTALGPGSRRPIDARLPPVGSRRPASAGATACPASASRRRPARGSRSPSPSIATPSSVAIAIARADRHRRRHLEVAGARPNLGQLHPARRATSPR